MDMTLPDVLDTAWRLLGRGAADRRSPIHTPVVASIDPHGLPDARVMVLRAANRATANLRFHTDSRSPKCAALHGRPVSILGYHPGEAVQLRLSGVAQVVTEGADVDTIWAASTPFARRCYLVESPPGTAIPAASSGLPEWMEGRKPEPADLLPARPNFALAFVAVTGIDFLHLAQTGHRRAVFRAEDGWAGGWITP